jgi:single-strand DNA-binding protein
VPNGTASSPGGNLTNFAKTLQKGQLVSLEREIEYRAIKETAKGQQVKYTIAKIDAPSMRRLSKVEASDDPSDGANDV